MRRIALFATVTALLATAATGSAGAVYPDTIALPNGWLPEGIATAPDGTFYLGLARQRRRLRREPAHR